MAGTLHDITTIISRGQHNIHFTEINQESCHRLHIARSIRTGQSACEIKTTTISDKLPLPLPSCLPNKHAHFHITHTHTMQLLPVAHPSGVAGSPVVEWNHHPCWLRHHHCHGYGTWQQHMPHPPTTTHTHTHCSVTTMPRQPKYFPGLHCNPRCCLPKCVNLCDLQRWKWTSNKKAE